MLGQMQQAPLLLTDILRHALRNSADQEIVTRLVEGGMHRYTFADAGKRIAQLAHALTDMGIGMGDRVGVIGWNTHRQLELYYALAGIGAVCHTINPRLGPENAGYVMAHAGDKAVFYDATFAPLAAGLAPHLKSVEHYVEMCPEGQVTEVPIETQSYEALIAGKAEEYDWPTFDENTACAMCYTSGTTGKPKGVLYSHRSLVLQCIVSALPNSLGCEQGDVCLPVVPMFHVNAWGVPYTALLLGMKLVMPGPGLDGPSLHELIVKEEVTYALGVPTVWQGLLAHVEGNNLDFGKLKYSLIGGSALSEQLIRGYDKYGVKCRQGWGMTEMSPLGTINVEPEGFYDLPIEERVKRQIKQGPAVPFVDMRIVDKEGTKLAHDGEAEGHLQVRGPWIIDTYYGFEENALTKDGWFDTGDVAVIHPDGVMQITDRAKDVIKSGGEWISSIDIENAALNHPAVMQAAALGMHHPKWDERPLLVIQLKPGQEADFKEVQEFVNKQLPKISAVDDVQVVDEIPLGATGKVLKTKLREHFKDYTLPTAA
ncbi:long-chain-fatty-acid--CoA ligase [Parvularcula sp. ZS-1/3]|uniref:Long-chain-fatty-acid--CoA ligase n=1 Tax=Parvularcula mediterranea TaxID=2732508 RepID=A0A7Y3W4A1_9PROT|nr:long-chain-fatty-acid--CoA ligase [Parvularcula mediterranea]NNU15263.1 long-chain-fatty-acid--CoA ligase [Parvularcula mediterranea]